MAVNAFLKIAGIDGESTDDKHADWIEILSYHYGVAQPTSAVASTAGGGTTGRCDHQDFSIVKLLDKASPKLFEACCTGKHIDEITLELYRADGDANVKYMEYKLTNAIVSSYRPGGSMQGKDSFPMEEVAFNYAKVEVTYTQQKRKGGGGGGQVSAGWDLEKNKKV